MSNEQDDDIRNFQFSITFMLAPPGSTEYTRQSLRPLQHRRSPVELQEQVLSGAELANIHPLLENLGRMAPVLLLVGHAHFQGQPSAADSALASLQILTSLSEKRRLKHRICAICQEDFPMATAQNQKDIVRLPCHHLFHKECVFRWLKMSCTCPSCRYELLTENEDYNVGVRERMTLRDRELGEDTDAETEGEAEEAGPSNPKASPCRKRKRSPTTVTEPVVTRHSKRSRNGSNQG